MATMGIQEQATMSRKGIPCSQVFGWCTAGGLGKKFFLENFSNLMFACVCLSEKRSYLEL
jgi:hypothetical protein